MLTTVFVVFISGALSKLLSVCAFGCSGLRSSLVRYPLISQDIYSIISILFLTKEYHEILLY